MPPWSQSLQKCPPWAPIFKPRLNGIGNYWRAQKRTRQALARASKQAHIYTQICKQGSIFQELGHGNTPSSPAAQAAQTAAPAAKPDRARHLPPPQLPPYLPAGAGLFAQLCWQPWSHGLPWLPHTEVGLGAGAWAGARAGVRYGEGGGCRARPGLR
eukprot:346254-Pelagomonas_calceolata.AAC.17